MIPWNHYYHLIPGHNKMGRGGVQCVRISFIVLNVLVCLFSCAALGLGIWLQIHTSGTTRLIAQYATISSAAFMIAVGCIGILVCIMGCCGSWSVNRCLLMLVGLPFSHSKSLDAFSSFFSILSLFSAYSWPKSDWRFIF
jgi:hypothetical protein